MNIYNLYSPRDRAGSCCDRDEIGLKTIPQKVVPCEVNPWRCYIMGVNPTEGYPIGGHCIGGYPKGSYSTSHIVLQIFSREVFLLEPYPMERSVSGIHN